MFSNRHVCNSPTWKLQSEHEGVVVHLGLWHQHTIVIVDSCKKKLIHAFFFVFYVSSWGPKKQVNIYRQEELNAEKKVSRPILAYIQTQTEVLFSEVYFLKLKPNAFILISIAVEFSLQPDCCQRWHKLCLTVRVNLINVLKVEPLPLSFLSRKVLWASRDWPKLVHFPLTRLHMLTWIFPTEWALWTRHRNPRLESHNIKLFIHIKNIISPVTVSSTSPARPERERKVRKKVLLTGYGNSYIHVVVGLYLKKENHIKYVLCY